MEVNAGYLIYRVGRLLRHRSAQFLKGRGSDISPEQWAILIQVAEKQTPSMGDLVDSTLNDHPNVTRLVAGLERAGLVQREADPKDRRNKMVSLTESGAAFVGEIQPQMAEARDRFFRDLGQEETAALVRMLTQVQARLEE